MRSTVAACAILVLLIGTVDAEHCPSGALGVSRTLVVDPNEHPRVGSMQYPETLPLNDHEVVLTFDDGPVPRYTTRSPTTPKTTPFAKCLWIRRRARSKRVLRRCATPSATRRRCRLSFGYRVCCARSRSSSTSRPMAI